MDYRSDFSDFGNTTYLDVAGQGPLPRTSAQAIRRAMEWKELPHKAPAEMFLGLPNHVRELVAQMIGAKPSEISISTGASTGLMTLACGIDWKPEDEVLIPQCEFPAIFCTFAPLAERGQLLVRTVRARERYLRAEDFLECIGPKTRLVATSLVRFHDATRIDVRPIAEACHAVGAWLLLDVSQCAGAMPVNVGELGADFVVSAAYKWLLSPYGTGFFWAREECMRQMRPAPFYWTALPNVLSSDTLDLPPYRPDESPRRWDAAETANLNLVGMEASLEYLVKVGVDTVWQHNTRLIEQLIERLPVDRCVLASPADPRFRGPYVCVAGRSPEKTRAIHQNLQKADLFMSLRENAIRIAPHLYNGPSDIDRLIAALTI